MTTIPPTSITRRPSIETPFDTNVGVRSLVCGADAAYNGADSAAARTSERMAGRLIRLFASPALLDSRAYANPNYEKSVIYAKFRRSQMATRQLRAHRGGASLHDADKRST